MKSLFVSYVWTMVAVLPCSWVLYYHHGPIATPIMVATANFIGFMEGLVRATK